jgi:hypothetical protein
MATEKSTNVSVPMTEGTTRDSLKSTEKSTEVNTLETSNPTEGTEGTETKTGIKIQKFLLVCYMNIFSLR